jgi:outer membrane protein OmpA-like peptidoglycan-associated protein
MKTYEALVTQLGGVKVYEGIGGKMIDADLKFSDPRHRALVERWPGNPYRDDQMGVYVVRTPQRNIWIEVYKRDKAYQKDDNYYLTVIETKPLEVKAAFLPAAAMKQELDAKGHVALYINFDFDKASIRPDSQPIIDEVTTLLRSNPGLHLKVEGHTDNVGQSAYNRTLSEARARSVVAALTGRGVEPRRLSAAGYGPDKPIADNGTDTGRASNRRVELVKL